MLKRTADTRRHATLPRTDNGGGRREGWNALFVMLFAGSALLIRRAANVRPELGVA